MKRAWTLFVYPDEKREADKERPCQMSCPSGTQYVKASEQTLHPNTALVSPAYINKATLNYTTKKTTTVRRSAGQVLTSVERERCVSPPH
jgi:hypothetical protein